MSDQPRTISYDCRYFLGDRPCTWHKKEGVHCQCEHFQPLAGDILIIKLDAIGDVLRTTCLLPAIARRWPGRRITWITQPASLPLLEHNPFIDQAVAYGSDALLQLETRSFERVINLDAGKRSAALASMARGKQKAGYLLHSDGTVRPTNGAARQWLEMGVFDDLKKANDRSYQQIMCSILDLPQEDLRYVLELRQSELEWGRRRLRELGVDLDRTLIGIHSGGGGRWELKQWHEERFVALVPQLLEALGEQAQVVLFGGPLERERNRRIRQRMPGQVFDTGCDNSLRQFASLVDGCSLMLSGDSLAMHVALARGCRTVVLFGPTSHAEIELFGQGEKVIPDLDCLVCYKTQCDFVPNCMDSISVEQVKQAVLRQVAALPGQSAGDPAGQSRPRAAQG